jgi:hypothetical protein
MNCLADAPKSSLRTARFVPYLKVSGRYRLQADQLRDEQPTCYNHIRVIITTFYEAKCQNPKKFSR